MACEWCDVYKQELVRRDAEIAVLNEHQFNFSISMRDVAGFLGDIYNMGRQSAFRTRKQNTNKPSEQGGYICEQQ